MSTISTRLIIICIALASNALATRGTLAQSNSRVWTIPEILSERAPVPTRNKAEACNNPGASSNTEIKKCVCAEDVTSLVQYRPSIRECKKNAGIIVSGRYTKMFSAVVRDTEDRDRWPARGINGCSKAEVSAGTKRCSAFKTQKIIKVKNANGDAQVHCLGASGYSSLFRNVARITIKLKSSGASAFERLCIAGPRLPLN